MRLKCLGGFKEQGRSALLVEGYSKFLIDFGVKKVISSYGIGEIPKFDFDKIDFIVVTHAHQDHTAMIPLLIEKGIEVPIFGTEPTKKFTIKYCEGWLKTVEEMGFEPPYTQESIEKLEKLFVSKKYYEPFNIGKTRITLIPSGHLIGASIIYVEDEKSLVHFGDIDPDNPINLKPTLDFKADIGIINGAYGDRIMPREVLEELFIEKINEGKNVLIPVASLGRAQEILLILWKCKKKINKKIYVSKSIIENTENLLSFPEYIEKNSVKVLENILKKGFLKVFNKNEMDKILNSESIFLLPDGMLMGKEVEFVYNKIKDDEENVIILTGYQAPGTLGRKLEDKEVIIKAKFYRHELKAHGDYYDNYLIVSKVLNNSKLILIHHGEEPKSSELALRFLKDFSTLNIVVPTVGSEFVL